VFVNGQAITFPRTGIAPADIHGVWHTTVRTFPDGAGFTDIQYGPLRVPRKGDTIELTDRTVERWRIFLEREGHRVVRRFGSVTVDGQDVTRCIVQRDYYFVLGDNRDNSMDSRYWGFVPDENVAGAALAVYWSWDPAIGVSNLSDKLSSIRWDRIGTLVR
jgi:signal peptidase I